MGALGDVLVAGLGRSGDAAARYCASLLGSEVSSVTAIDSSDSEAVAHRARSLEELGVCVRLGTDAVAGHYHLAIASPGIRPDSALMAAVHSVADEVISEIEFAYRRSHVPWVAITGTNGKTTTTALVTHLLGTAGVDARAVGNIGSPAIEAVSEDLGSGVLVAEVSSFQLALTQDFHPRVAVLLNITPDHLDWHGSLEGYVADKVRVFQNLGPDDVAVVDIDDAGSRPFATELASRGVGVVAVSRAEGRHDGATVSGDRLVLHTHSGPLDLVAVDDLQIKGPHNVSNALAAAAAAHAMGASPHAISRGLRSFAPIEHRLEPAGTACGAEWFNDSKATNPDAVFKALEAFGDRPLVLLLGGRNKGNDFGPLARAAAARARFTIAFGEAGEEIEQAFLDGGDEVSRVATLSDAVRAAAGIVRMGDAVVLSPACASFDEFTDYEARGRAFKDLVRALECEERT